MRRANHLWDHINALQVAINNSSNTSINFQVGILATIFNDCWGIRALRTIPCPKSSSRIITIRARLSLWQAVRIQIFSKRMRTSTWWPSFSRTTANIIGASVAGPSRSIFPEGRWQVRRIRLRLLSNYRPQTMKKLPFQYKCRQSNAVV